MRHEQTGALDVVEELRLRRWARVNYVSADERNSDWHPVVLQEMQHKEAELAIENSYRHLAGAIVPLHPGAQHFLHDAHAETIKAERLLRIPAIP